MLRWSSDENLTCNDQSPLTHTSLYTSQTVDLLLSLFCCNCVHVFQLCTFPEPGTLLSSFVYRSLVWMCLPPHSYSCWVTCFFLFVYNEQAPWARLGGIPALARLHYCIKYVTNSSEFLGPAKSCLLLAALLRMTSVGCQRTNLPVRSCRSMSVTVLYCLGKTVESYLHYLFLNFRFA